MKSGKQRRIELRAQRQAHKAKLATQELVEREVWRDVDCTALAPNNSYDEPDFVKRRYYFDQPFTCASCNGLEVWTAVPLKWWYEVARGVYLPLLSFCRTCRLQEQSRRAEARRIHLEGIATKCH